MTVAAVRRFNRFYTGVLGLLDEHHPDSDFSLAEGRLVYELAAAGETTAAELGRRMGTDKAQVSRVVDRLSRRGMITARRSPHHGKHRLLSLTSDGQTAFARLDAGTEARIAGLLTRADDDARASLIDAMTTIEAILGDATPGSSTLRAPANGELAWIAHRQALIYEREFGWDAAYEALELEILGDYATTRDPAREDGWVVTRDGRVGGSIFLMRGDTPEEAKLRLLYVEPWLRGAGAGRLLVATCVARARALGYRRLVLWTNSVLVSARRIYEAAGFALIAEQHHHSFGHDLIGQTWALDL